MEKSERDDTKEEEEGRTLVALIFSPIFLAFSYFPESWKEAKLFLIIFTTVVAVIILILCIF